MITGDQLKKAMAGPAIRAFEIARVLAAAGNQVVLASPAESELESSAFEIVRYDADVLRRLAPAQDVILFQGWALESFPFLRDSGACLVADVYGPFTLELLVTRELQGEAELTDVFTAQVVLNEQLRQCDFFICASERQRDYWLGALTSLNRVNAENYALDPELRRLVDVCPFGVPDEPPKHRAPAMRGVVPGIGQDDLILYWGGGVYNWFDPLTLIRGIAEAAGRHPNLRLVFSTASHPNPLVPRMRMLTQARQLADDLGLTGRHVFFNENWIAYDRRVDWLLESDVGVSTHQDHVEAHFSYRTRFLDYFWVGLPILCTRGDVLAEAVERHDMGVVVPQRDVAAVAAAIDRLAEPAARRRQSRNSRKFGASLTWTQTLAPLVRFCAEPRRAPDLLAAAPRRARPVPVRVGYAEGPRNWRYLTLKAVDLTLNEGPLPMFRRGGAYLRKRVRRESG